MDMALVHGDARLENFFVNESPDGVDVTTIDFQVPVRHLVPTKCTAPYVPRPGAPPVEKCFTSPAYLLPRVALVCAANLSVLYRVRVDLVTCDLWLVLCGAGSFNLNRVTYFVSVWLCYCSCWLSICRVAMRHTLLDRVSTCNKEVNAWVFLVDLQLSNKYILKHPCPFSNFLFCFDFWCFELWIHVSNFEFSICVYVINERS